MTSTEPEKLDTESRLLNAAEELFALNGYESVSVREITQAADCNVASVNYYFGGKDKMYESVMRRRLRELNDFRIPKIAAALEDESSAPIEVLRVYARVFVQPILESRGQHTMMLLNREMSAPHLPAGMMMREFFPPYIEINMRICHRYWPVLGEKEVNSVMSSFFGQLIHLLNASSYLKREGFEAPHLENFDEALEHIVIFTLAGIERVVEECEA